MVATAPWLDACSPASFRKAVHLVSPLMPGAVQALGGVDAVCEPYAKAWLALRNVSEAELPRTCRTYSPSSRKGTGLLLNAGAGTSGTRFVHCVITMSTNLKTRHNPHLNATDRKHITDDVDSFDLLSDSPIPYMLGPLLASHSGVRSSGVLLSLRDPWAWLASRNRHKGDHCCSVPTAPCGSVPLSSINDSSLAVHFFAYQTWAACLATSSQLGYDIEHLFAFNLFESMPSNLTDSFYVALRRFLGAGAGLSVPTRLSDKHTFLKAWSHCSKHRRV